MHNIMLLELLKIKGSQKKTEFYIDSTFLSCHEHNFTVIPQYIVAWTSKNSLLETVVNSEV